MTKLRRLFGWLPRSTKTLNADNQAGPRDEETKKLYEGPASTAVSTATPSTSTPNDGSVGHANNAGPTIGPTAGPTVGAVVDANESITRTTAEGVVVLVTFSGPFGPEAPLGHLGQYAIQERLGEGGQGSVYKAFDSKRNRLVAIKVVQGGQQVEERVIREARRTSTDHTNLVRVYDYASIGETHFLVLEFIQGRTLRETMAAGPIEIRRAVEWLKQAAVALDALHARGIVHLDLHAKNIMIREADNEAVIIDLGLERQHSEDGTHKPDGGTARYISPEHARGNAVDHRGDIYSLGVLLYRMLSQRLPHEGTDAQVQYGLIHIAPPSPKIYNHRIPKTLEKIVLRCLEKEPEKRYQSAKQLLSDLTLWEEFKPTRAHPLKPWQRAWLAIAYRNRLASLSVAFFSILAAVSTVSALRIRSDAARLEAEALLTAKAHQDTRQLLSETIDAAARFANVSNGLSQEILRKSRPYYERVLEVNQNISDKLAEVAEANFSLAFTLNSLNDNDKAKEYSRAADACFYSLKLQDKLADGDLRLLATYSMERPILAKLLGTPLSKEDSLEFYSDAINFAKQLLATNPGRVEHKELLANAYTNLGSFTFDQNDYDAAIETKQLAIDLLIGSVKDAPSISEKCAFLEMDQGLANLLKGDKNAADSAYARATTMFVQAPTLVQSIVRFDQQFSAGRHLATEAGRLSRSDLNEQAQLTLKQSIRLCLSILSKSDLSDQSKRDWIARALQALDVAVALQVQTKDPKFDFNATLQSTDQVLAVLDQSNRADLVQQRLETHSLRYRLNSLYGQPILKDLEPIVLDAPWQYGQPINRILLARAYTLDNQIAQALEQVGKLKLDKLTGDLQFDLACVYSLIAERLTDEKTRAMLDASNVKSSTTDEMALKALALLNNNATLDTIRQINFQEQLDGDLVWLKKNRDQEIQKIREATGK